MFAAKPMVAIHEHPNERGNRESGYLALITHRARLLIEHKGIVADRLKLEEVQELLKERTNVLFTTETVDTILRMYPEANVKLALYGLDTEVTDLVLNAFAHFFLGTSWPINGDYLQQGQKFAWHDLFRKQVFILGLGQPTT